MASTDLVTLGYAPTPEVSTGDPATVNDTYDSTKPLNGAKLTPGQAVYFLTSGGAYIKCRYVRYNPTVAQTEIVGPVFWKDQAKTTVTPLASEAVSATVNSIAGLLLNISVTDGNFVFIQVAGPKSAVAVIASTAAGDALIGGATSQITARVAANTAPTNKVFAWANTARSGGGASDIEIVCESL